MSAKDKSLLELLSAMAKLKSASETSVGILAKQLDDPALLKLLSVELPCINKMKNNPHDFDVEPNGPKLAPILFGLEGFPAVLHCRFRILNS